MTKSTLSLIATAVCFTFCSSAWSAGPPQDHYDDETTEAFIAEPTVVAKPVASKQNTDIPTATVEASPTTITSTIPSALALNTQITPYTDLWGRIRAGFSMPSLNTLLVQKHIQSYTAKPDYLGRIFDRGQKYLYHIVEQIEKRNMPMELALLPVVESAFNPQAYSPAAAAGLWQFVPSTATQYGLEQTMWYDGRRDVLAATDAALTYLDKLHTQFGDWQLALAAYNWGEGAVQNAISKNLTAGLPTDYNSLNMPLETRNYVPKLMAIRAIVEAPEQYGLNLPIIKNMPYFTAISTKKHMDVKLAAQLANMDEAEFLSLNPAYKLPVIAYKESRKLLIPVNKAPLFNLNLSNYNQPLLNWHPYVTETKESINAIAKRHQIEPDALKHANAIEGNWVSAGKVLLVPRLANQEIDENMRLKQAATLVSPTTSTTEAPKTVMPIVATVEAAPEQAPAATAAPIASVETPSIITPPPAVITVATPTTNTVEPTKPVQEAATAMVNTQALTPRPALIAQTEPLLSNHAITSQAIELPVKVITEEELNALRPAPHSKASYEMNLPTAKNVNPPVAIATKPLATNTSKPVAAVKTPPRPTHYTVQKGDTLSSIASQFNLDIAILKAHNKLKSDVAPLAMRLRIPKEGAPLPLITKAKPAQPEATTSSTLYKVKRGDTLASIAKTYNTSIEDIKAANKLRNDVAPLGASLSIPSNALPVTAKAEPELTTKTKGKRKQVTEPIVHEVKRGDNLAKIAEAHGIEVADLKAANKIHKDTIVMGDELIIPTSQNTKKEAANLSSKKSKKNRKQSYVVQAGDTLIGIAKRFDVNAEALGQYNGKTSRSLRPGIRLNIPTFD